MYGLILLEHLETKVTLGHEINVREAQNEIT